MGTIILYLSQYNFNTNIDTDEPIKINRYKSDKYKINLFLSKIDNQIRQELILFQYSLPKIRFSPKMFIPDHGPG